jgi:hypothetical protein
MKTQNRFKIAGILVMLLGVVHCSATPIIFPLFKESAPIDPASVYMFFMVGLSTIFIGWLQYFTIKRVMNDQGFLTIIKVTLVFMSILGIAAVCSMWNNPFAYLSLIIAMYEWILFFKFRPAEK